MKSLKIIMILAALVICCALAVGCNSNKPTDTTSEITDTEKPTTQSQDGTTAAQSSAEDQTTAEAQTTAEVTTANNTITTADTTTSANTPVVTNKPSDGENDVTNSTTTNADDPMPETTVTPADSTAEPDGTVTPGETTTDVSTSADTPETTTEEAVTNSPEANFDLKFAKTPDDKGYSVIDIGDCTDTSIVIPAYYNDLPVVKIEANAFDRKSIVSIFIPDTVTAIGANAFDLCSALESVTFSAKLQAIGDGAFADCGILKSVALPSTLTEVGKGIFAGCHALQSITMNGSGAYKTEGNCLIETATATVVAGCKLSTIPGGIKVIGESAFARLTMLSKINVPTSVTKIEKNVFNGCVLLKSIYYAGDEASWQAINKATGWNTGAGSYMLYFE